MAGEKSWEELKQEISDALDRGDVEASIQAHDEFFGWNDGYPPELSSSSSDDNDDEDDD